MIRRQMKREKQFKSIIQIAVSTKTQPLPQIYFLHIAQSGSALGFQGNDAHRYRHHPKRKSSQKIAPIEFIFVVRQPAQQYRQYHPTRLREHRQHKEHKSNHQNISLLFFQIMPVAPQSRQHKKSIQHIFALRNPRHRLHMQRVNSKTQSRKTRHLQRGIAPTAHYFKYK